MFVRPKSEHITALHIRVREYWSVTWLRAQKMRPSFGMWPWGLTWSRIVQQHVVLESHHGWRRSPVILLMTWSHDCSAACSIGVTLHHGWRRSPVILVMTWSQIVQLKSKFIEVRAVMCENSTYVVHSIWFHMDSQVVCMGIHVSNTSCGNDIYIADTCYLKPVRDTNKVWDICTTFNCCS
jgi:hypothetical protein